MALIFVITNIQIPLVKHFTVFIILQCKYNASNCVLLTLNAHIHAWFESLSGLGFEV